MSMLSSKCDGLRNAADELQNVIDNAHNYTWQGIVSTLHYAQQGLRSAADTIWELRNKLAGVVDQSEEVERLQAENAKLRELVKAFWWCTEDSDLPYKCDRCPLSQSSKVECECELIMRELGIEAR